MQSFGQIWRVFVTPFWKGDGGFLFLEFFKISLLGKTFEVFVDVSF